MKYEYLFVYYSEDGNGNEMWHGEERHTWECPLDNYTLDSRKENFAYHHKIGKETHLQVRVYLLTDISDYLSA